MAERPKFLLQYTPEEVFAVHARDEAAIETLLGSTLPNTGNLPPFTLFIAQSQQLYDYVQVIPALAWELLEYAVEPLEIVYPQKKAHYLPWWNTPEICVRWIRQPKLEQWVHKHGPFLTVRTESFAPKIAQHNWNPKVVNLQEKEPYQHVKTIRLREDDTFTFLR